jgi:quercetin dioxygenase-like cupin family protein
MNVRRWFVQRWIIGLFLLCCLPVYLVAEDAGGMVMAAAASSKFVNLPGLPACLKISVQRGDPTKQAATLLLKFAPGCVVPWHWHSAGEQLLVVSGTGSAQMKDGKSAPVHAGDYAYLPAKNVHQFKAVTAVTMFLLPDAAFDIHYVDRDGKEVPAENVLKAAPKKAAPAKSSDKQ